MCMHSREQYHKHTFTQNANDCFKWFVLQSVNDVTLYCLVNLGGNSNPSREKNKSYKNIYSLCFVDDKVSVAQDKDRAAYLI
jgi:hypothetical protein